MTPVTPETFTAALQPTTPCAWLWLIALLPLAGAAVNGIIGKKLQDAMGKAAVHTVAVGVMAGSALLVVAAFLKLMALPAHARYLLDSVFPMIHLGKLHVDMAFALDPLSAMMALIITIIGAGIHVYSIGYM